MRFLFIIAFLFLLFPFSSKGKTDSLWNIWTNTSRSDTFRLHALNEYTWNEYLFTDPDSAFQLAEMQYEYADKKGLKKYMADALNTKGISLYIKGEYKKAIKYYKESLQLRKAIGDKKGMSSSLNNLGIIYRVQGNFFKAIDYYTQSLKIDEEAGNRSGVASTLSNIGVIYEYQENYEKAMDYFQRSMKIEKEVGDKKGLASSLVNIGVIYEYKGQEDKALEYYEKSLEIEKNIGNKEGMSRALNNIGVVYSGKGDNEKALEHYKKSLEIRRELGERRGIATSLKNIAIVYLNQADSAVSKKQSRKAEKYYRKAIKQLQRSLKIASEMDAIVIQRDANKAIYRCYKGLGLKRKALTTYEKYIDIRDSIKNERNQREVIRQKYKYEYEKKAYADSVKQAEEKKLTRTKIEAQKAKLKQEQTRRYALYGGLGLLLLFGGFMYNRFRLTNRQKQIIEQQKAEVELQKSEAEHQKHIAEAKNEEILDSIAYAKRLQEAILPPRKMVKQWLEQSLILYKPKDIVAGDFYWMETLDDAVYFAAADCTGHGVPGAMVSVVCSNALSKALIEENISDPGEILDRTRKLVIERFGRSEQEIKDGMDIALCKLELPTDGQPPTANRQLAYAGAHNPLWIIRKGVEEVEEIKADKQPIGSYVVEKPFSTHEVTLHKGDSVYIFSDGFTDQFGGKKGKKYKSGRFKEFLLSIRDKGMDEQRKMISKEFENWKGNLEQLDDVCIVGVRI